MVETKENNLVFKIIKKIVSITITLILLFMALIIVVQRVTGNAFLGFRMYIVATGSMTGVYDIGDVIISKEKDTKDINVGDDVVYEGRKGNVSGMTITHRVIDIEEKNGERFFHTKGVANTLEDPLVSGDQIKGVVIHKMMFATFICSLAQNKYTIYFFLVLPITLFVFFKIIHVDIRKEK